MKTIKQGLAEALALLLISSTQALCVLDQAIHIQGTNLVLSWPSLGYEYYMIQYRPALNPDSPWVQLTNAHPANSTNRTTFVVPCCVLSALAAANGAGSFSGDNPPTPAGLSAADADSAAADGLTELWAVPADGSGDAVPFALYPLGFDTNGLTIFEVTKTESEGQGSSLSDSEVSAESYGISSGGCDCPATGFFRVWHIPDFPAGITNYTFDGPTFIPVEFKDYMDRVDNIEVLLNGEPTTHAEFMSLYYDGRTNWGMGIYFDRLPSGTHQLQLRCTLRLMDEIEEETAYLVLSNLTRSIAVDNEITFTNWDDLIQNTNYAFKARTKNTGTDWSIDIYDAWDNYVNGSSGYATNGRFEWVWDLTDWQGNNRDNAGTDPFFYSITTFKTAAGGQTARYNPVLAPRYPEVGYWLFAYQDTFYTGSAGEIYTNAMNALTGGPSYRGIPWTVSPISFGTNNYTQLERDLSWAVLVIRLGLTDYRNFYYYGHGNSYRISCDENIYDTNGVVIGGHVLPDSHAFLDAKTIRERIMFSKNSGVHQYRFVWLDSCYSAKGDLPGAFGVSKATNTLAYYTNGQLNTNHFRPSAFVGWDSVNGGGPGWGSLQSAMNFRTQWMFDWHYNWQSASLWDAFYYARQHSTWPPGGDEQLRDNLRVYGYSIMKFNEYNSKNDWSWPAP